MTRRLPFGLALLLAGCAAPATLSPPPLLPRPVRVEPAGGEFRFSAATRVLLQPDDAGLRALADLFLAPLREGSGLPLPVSAGGGAPRQALILRLAANPAGRDTAFAPEGYELRIGRDSAVVEAGTAAGAARALQALRQLLPAGYERAVQRTSATAWGVAPLPPVSVPRWTLPAVRISDSPRFSYRGLHLDVGRHFFPVPVIKQYIDLLALYRLNTFHWHLTEDQGWRIQIQRYPRLTEVGGCRRETMVARNFDPYIGDGIRYCGFYTQDEVREVVAYAAARQITIVPEIELPGHSLAAIAAYPELACEPGPFEVSTQWGVFEPIYCPSEETFTFLENVLTEVLALFPSQYIHIGGDEAPKKLWRLNAVAQEVIRREGLKDEDELQSYFIRRIESFLSSHGRKLIGWDEILEGGLPPAATVMSWRGTRGGIAAAKAGHDVVMTPGSHVYLDHYQGNPAYEPLAIGGFSPLEKVYSYEPVPTELNAEEAKHVLGAQGNVWTEYIATREQVQYMAYPRAAALAEVLWSPAAARDYAAFLPRLGEQLRRLDLLGINYRIPDVRGMPADSVVTASWLQLQLRSVHPDGVVRYTLNGAEPTAESPAAESRFELMVPPGGMILSVRTVLPSGRMSSVQVVKVRPGG